MAWLISSMLLFFTAAQPATSQPRLGFNLKQDEHAPWQSAGARRSLKQLAASGVHEVSFVVFLWQATPSDAHVQLGADSDLAALSRAIRVARANGLDIVIKPHVWVPGHWAGEVRPRDEAGMATWFAAYQRVLLELADVARREHASRLVIGTELRHMADRPEWLAVIRAVRAHFPGELQWVADSVESAQAFKHWSLFPAISVSVYPAAARGEQDWRPALERANRTLIAFARLVGKPIRVAEIGMPSMAGGLQKPWEGPDQSTGRLDLALQTRAYQDVLAVFANSAISVDFWCWYTNPEAGGARDRDFTPQGKPALLTLRASAAAHARNPVIIGPRACQNCP